MPYLLLCECERRQANAQMRYMVACATKRYELNHTHTRTLHGKSVRQLGVGVVHVRDLKTDTRG